MIFQELQGYNLIIFSGLSYLNCYFFNTSGPPDSKTFLVVYASWKDQFPCNSRHWVRNICIFGLEDLHQLVNRHELFVNKFHLDFQPLALDCLEEWLYNRTYQQLQTDYRYYKQLAFINKGKQH